MKNGVNNIQAAVFNGAGTVIYEFIKAKKWILELSIQRLDAQRQKVLVYNIFFNYLSMNFTDYGLQMKA